MPTLIAEADAGDFHLEIRCLDGKWEWAVSIGEPARRQQVEANPSKMPNPARKTWRG
jgi:hypothetical protein